ncbi:MAG: 16S rRNA (adenine(1518)-N(6)/adenine(1519)-N(6))-dimethyltransferase RsmA [Sulfurospirillaceae bacterium]|nr:16S rRNA (adenine(1518)-N(6)/adenine(1519)-N(6))-dimethyltransferase RsmA [Sulfurospirillaceae bacterium]
MIEAKKKFGQNFLIDSTVLSKIIQSMPNTKRKLVEIGPGLGDLTQVLLEQNSVKAYEVDKDLCVHLRKKFHKEIKENRLELVEGDVLECFQKGSLEGEPYDVVANLPYYIATKIILEALEDKMCKSMLVMIQKEVAQKFSALPKTKEFSSLSILSQSIADVKLLFDVDPSSFEPQPKVVSSIVSIVKKKEFSGDQNSLFDNESDYNEFKRYLRVSFSSPRKTWIKNISSAYDKTSALELLKKNNISITSRPHELCVTDHLNLFREILKIKVQNGKEYDK